MLLLLLLLLLKTINRCVSRHHNPRYCQPPTVDMSADIQ